MKIFKYCLIFILLVSISCRKEIDNPFDDWFQDPPVKPITQTIKTLVPIGYAASVVAADMKGYSLTKTKSVQQKSSKLIYVDTETNYPYKFKGDTYGQMIIAYVETGPNTALVSVFFTDMDIVSGKFKLENVIAFPVIIDELNNKITAVYAWMDVNLGSNLIPGIDLTQEEIDANMEKLDYRRTGSSLDEIKIAISQDAWIVDVYHHNTFDDLLDDDFKFYGGQQAIDVEDYETESSTGALQMAMIDVDFSYECLNNPTNGFVFMQDVEVETSTSDNNIVFGHVFYEFHSRCDGDIVVDIATGNFLFAIGSELELGLQ